MTCLHAGISPSTVQEAWNGGNGVKEEVMKAFYVGASASLKLRSERGIPISDYRSRKHPQFAAAIRLGLGRETQWAVISDDTRKVPVITDGRITDCAIEQLDHAGETIHVVTSPIAQDRRALVKISTNGFRTVPVVDKGTVTPIFGNPYHGLTGYAFSGNRQFQGERWQESLYILQPFLPRQQLWDLEAVVVHIQEDKPRNDLVCIFDGNEIKLISMDQFLSICVVPWLSQASEQAFLAAFTLANERKLQGLAFFLREKWADLNAEIL